jgi:sec-independent protein translocase protein TatA
MLFINNIGGLEILVILLFVLMFFGAKSIPGLARTLGKGMREIQHASDEIKREIRKTGDNIKKDLTLGDDVTGVISDMQNKPKQLLDQIESNVLQTKNDIDSHVIKSLETKDNVENQNTEDKV